MPASSARTSDSRYRRCPPRVRIDDSLPALAHRVTVLGSTRKRAATSAGGSRGSAASGDRGGKRAAPGGGGGRGSPGRGIGGLLSTSKNGADTPIGTSCPVRPLAAYW